MELDDAAVADPAGLAAAQHAAAAVVVVAAAATAAGVPPYRTLIQLPSTSSRTAKTLSLFAATLREHPLVLRYCTVARENARLIEIKAAPPMGLGAFAKEPIPKGTLLAVGGWTLSDAPDGQGAANNSVQCSGFVGRSKACYNLHLAREQAAGAAGRGEFVSLFHYWNNQCRGANCDFRNDYVQAARLGAPAVRVPVTTIWTLGDVPAGAQLFIRYNGDGKRQGQVECVCTWCRGRPNKNRV
jgi:hypothetical protein